MIFNLLKFLTNKEKVMLLLLLILIFIGTILEVLGYALIIPLLTIIIKSKSILIEFSIIKNNAFLSEYFVTTSVQNLVIHALFLMVSFFFIKNVFLISLMFFRESFFFNIKARLSKFFFKKYLLKSYPDFIKNNSSYYITNILNEVAMFVEKRIRAAIFILNETLIISFFFISLLLVNFNFTLVMFSIFTFILYIFLVITKNINLKYSKQRQLYDFKQIKDLNEGFALFKYLKIHHLEKMFFDKFSHSNKQVNNAGKVEIFLSEIPKNIFELASLLTIFFATLFFFSMGGVFIDVLPFLGFLVLAVARMIPSLTRISNSFQNFRFAEPSMKVLNNEITFDVQKSFFDPSKKLSNELTSIKLKNVSFEYNKKPVLKNISLTLEKNKIYGISGETGSGKTSLVDIIVGLHSNYDGNILLNDKKLTKPLFQTIDIAYVPQNIFLVDDTIRNNILFNNFDNKLISQDKINQVINITCLDSFLLKLDNGIETSIGENGASISGGQKQRIGLARSLINKPDLLILDEATNALNYEVSNKIIKNLKNQSMTILIISHDKEIIKNCDKQILIKNGNLEIL